MKIIDERDTHKKKKKERKKGTKGTEAIAKGSEILLSVHVRFSPINM